MKEAAEESQDDDDDDGRGVGGVGGGEEEENEWGLTLTKSESLHELVQRKMTRLGFRVTHNGTISHVGYCFTQAYNL